MICKKCGSNNEKTSVFCAYCGYPLTAGETFPKPESGGGSVHESTHKYTGIIIGAVSVAIVIFAVIIVIALSQRLPFINLLKYNPKTEDAAVSSYEGGKAIANISGNITNSGLVAEQDGWIYYSAYSSGGLYKISEDGKYKQFLDEGKPLYINVSGGWVYFCDDNENGCICKVSVNGGEKQVLNKDHAEQMTVFDGWIYYQNLSRERRIYRIRTDGSGETQLNDVTSYSTTLLSGWICYIDGDHGFTLYKMKTDGTDNTLLEDSKYRNLIASDGWYYFFGQDMILYKEKFDVQPVEVLSNIAGDYNVYDDWIYFENTKDSYLYKVSTDGTGMTPLNKSASSKISITGGWIYYINRNDNNALYRMKTDGTESQIMDIN